MIVIKTKNILSTEFLGRFNLSSYKLGLMSMNVNFDWYQKTPLFCFWIRKYKNVPDESTYSQLCDIIR